MCMAAYAGYLSVVPKPQGQGKVAILVAMQASIALLSILPRLNGWKAGRTEQGGLHHHGRRMILTGGKRSSAVLAACEKRRSGLAPSTTQGPGTKTESSLFGRDSHPTDRDLLLVEVSGRAVSRAYRRSGSSSNTATHQHQHQHQPKHLGVSCLSQVSSESKLAIKLESA